MPEYIDLSKVEQMVRDKFPRTDAEKKCAIERNTMNMLRDNYRRKLWAMYKEQQERLQNAIIG